MASVSSALSTLSFLGYSISIPDWLIGFLVFCLILSLPFTIVRLIRSFMFVGRLIDNDSAEDKHD